MNTMLLTTLVSVITASSFGCRNDIAQTRKDIIKEMYPEEQVKIKKMFNDLLDTARKKDMDRLEAVHLFGPKFTKYDETEPIIRLDGAAARKLERDFITASSQIEFSFQDLKVDVFGDVAIVTGLLDYRAPMGKEVVAGKDRMTMVLVKAGDEWKITHEHTCPMNPAPAQQPKVTK
jgi:ketosteroid isomerase-like protein